MKHTFMKVTSIALMLLCCFFLFAEGSGELVSVSVSSDYESGAAEVNNPIVKEFEDQLLKYQEDYEKLYYSMQIAYEKGDIDAYLSAKRELRSLEVPFITKEETEEAVKQIVASDDVNSAQLLFQYSRFYRPVLTLKAKSECMNYHSSLTVVPGSDISLPSLNTSDESLIFMGWGEKEGEVTYPAGESIRMPLEDKTLYAVFKTATEIQ